MCFCLENFLLRDDFTVKLGDFGLARTIERANAEQKGILGTHGYMSPEILENRHHDSKADIFACAIVLWEIFCQKTAFAQYQAFQIDALLLADVRPPCKNLHPALVTVLTSAWARLPTERPVASELCKQLEGLEQELNVNRHSIFVPVPSEDEVKSGPPSGPASAGSARSSIVKQVRAKLSRASRSMLEEDKEMPRVGSLQDRPVSVVFLYDEDLGEPIGVSRSREPSNDHRSISHEYHDASEFRKSVSGRKTSSYK